MMAISPRWRRVIPVRPQRYTRLGEVENTFGWTYPTFVTLLNDWIGAIELADGTVIALDVTVVAAAMRRRK